MGQSLFGQTRSELEKQRKQLEQQIVLISKNLSQSQSKQKSVLQKVDNINQRISKAEALVRVNNQEANMLTREINANSQAIDKLRNELKKLKQDYSQMVIDAYKSKSSQNRIMFLLSSNNFLQAYKRLQYMKQFAAHREQQGIEIQEQTKALQELNTRLFEQRKNKETLLAQNRKALERLKRDREAERELMASIRKEQGQYKREIERNQEKISKIDKMIRKMVRDAIAEENKKVGGTSTSRFKMTPEATILGNKFEDNKGKLPWPVEKGYVSRLFGTRKHAVVKTVNTKSDGVRIDTDENSKARAVFEGEVSSIKKDQISGIIIICIRHGQYMSVYKNIDKLYVKKGDKVKRNQFLGTIGKDLTQGTTTLGFYIFKNFSPQNPAEWIYKM